MRKPPLKRLPQFYSGDKPTLTKKEVDFLFDNPFIIEEKLDGSLLVEQHDDYLVMLEDMKYVHSIFYDLLPARYILVDVVKLNGERVNLKERQEWSKTLGYPLPPLLLNTTHKYDADYIIEYHSLDRIQSAFANKAPREGFVVKSEVNMTLGGKYSRFDLAGVERFKKDKTNHIIGHKNPM